jgi:GNAT superfamily N-acetyltransferase
MPWHTTTDLDEFEAHAGDFLRARPTENTLLLTTMDYVKTRGIHAYGDNDPMYGWWESPDATVLGAFLRTPPYPVLVSSVADDAVESLLDIVATMGRVNAERRLAEDLAARWLARSGEPCQIDRQTRLFRLDRLVPPRPAPAGLSRLAEPTDRELLVSWYGLFGSEVGEEHANLSTVVDARIEYGGLVLWQDGGIPVCMAGRSQPEAGTIRVGPVFTPVEFRRRGYASALTADISQRALELADEVVLFTDLANPTSNAIYQRLGYRPIEDRVWVSMPNAAG